MEERVNYCFSHSETACVRQVHRVRAVPDKSQIVLRDFTHRKYIFYASNVCCQCGYLSRAAALYLVAPSQAVMTCGTFLAICASVKREEGHGNGILLLRRVTYPFCFYLIIQSKPRGPVGKLSIRQLRAVILGCPKVEMNWRLVTSRNAYRGDRMEMLGSSLIPLHLVVPVGRRRKADGPGRVLRSSHSHSSIDLFIDSFQKCSLNPHYVFGTGPGSKETKMSPTQATEL